MYETLQYARTSYQWKLTKKNKRKIKFVSNSSSFVCHDKYDESASKSCFFVENNSSHY